MYKAKLIVALGILFWISLASASSCQCTQCIGNNLVKNIEVYEGASKCWYNQFKQILPQVKISSIAGLVDLLKSALKTNNTLVKQKCKVNLEFESCCPDEQDEFFECLRRSLITIGNLYRQQERCHGQDLPSEEIRMAENLLKGGNVGWKAIHPECA